MESVCFLVINGHGAGAMPDFVGFRGPGHARSRPAEIDDLLRRLEIRLQIRHFTK
jgi:hypothetical protein